MQGTALNNPALSNKALAPSSKFQQRWLDPYSLQFRLAIGVTAFSVLGLFGVSTWASWKIQEILINTHTENIKYLAERFPKDVTLYNRSLPIQTSIQAAIDKAPSDVILWVEDGNDEVTAQSQVLDNASDSFSDRLFSISKMPNEPQVYQIGQRYLVLCSTSLEVDGRTLGELYLAQDITRDQLKLIGAIRGLSLVSFLAVVFMAMAIAVYIQRSLRPLRKISHIAATISANDLSQDKMLLDRAPTEVKELADKLNEMLSRLGQAWKQQRQLIDDISHELRTPLSVSYGSLQCLQRRSPPLNETQQELLDTAVSETNRTVQLLQSLLDLARADNGCICFRSETLVLNDLVADLVKLAERSSNRVITVKAENPPLWMTTDRSSLSQVLTNLIDNAAKYSPSEEPIIIELSQDENHTTIAVRDYGCGILTEQQARIFDRFYRIDDARSRSTGGVGLGLAIVKTLVETMGGQITVWSNPGEGSKFTVTLPSQLKG